MAMWLPVVLLLGTSTYRAYGGIAPLTADAGLGAQPGVDSGLAPGAVGVGAADMGTAGVAGEFAGVAAVEGPGGAAAVGVERAAVGVAPVDAGVGLGDGAMLDRLRPGGQPGVGADPGHGVGGHFDGVGRPVPGGGRPPLGTDPGLAPPEETAQAPLSPEQIALNTYCAARCKTNHCYVEHMSDCRRYIVCENQTQGYHGTLRYCGHGTFWSTFNAKLKKEESVCELPALVQCPKDPCRVPDNDGGAYSHIVATDFGELPSCRQYWKCENLTSKPECCTNGFDYNPASGTCDKTRGQGRPCVDWPCTDICTTQEFTSYHLRDNNCLTHWTCVAEKTPQPSCCLAGERYNHTSRECEKNPRIPCTQTCPANYGTCSSGGQQYKLWLNSNRYPDRKYCRTYIKCVLELGAAEPIPQRRCCRSLYVFNEQTNQCEFSPEETDACDTSCPKYFKTDCHLYAIDGKPDMYGEEVHGISTTRPCPYGTFFNEDMCGCGVSAPTSRDNSCPMEVDINFHFKPMVNYGRESMINVQQFGTEFEGSVLNNQTTYYFNGDLRFNIDFFRQSLPKLFLHIDYRPDVVPPGERMTLVSNCRQSGLLASNPSLDVSLENEQVVFRAETPTNNIELRTAYTPGAWNQFKAYYDGAYVLITNIDARPGSQVQKDIGPMKGNINVAAEGLEIGLCKDRRGGRGGFKGDISRVSFTKCLTKNQIQFLLDEVSQIPAAV